MIAAQQQLTSDQAAMAHEQNMTALEASHAAQQDIRQHGLEIEQQQFQQQAQAVQGQIDAQQQAQQSGLDHAQTMQQNDQQHQQALEQQQSTPLTGATNG